MHESREFQGKTLDAAIADACAYYDATREKLEIEIVADAKSGIFGLVGARKAIIRARRAVLPERGRKAEREAAPAPEHAALKAQNGDMPHTDAPQAEANAPAAKALEDERPKGRRTRGRKADAEDSPQEARPEAALDGEAREPARHAEKEADLAPGRRPRPALQASQTTPGHSSTDSSGADAAQGRRVRPPKGGSSADVPASESDSDIQEMAVPRVPLAELDQDKLREVSAAMVLGLVRPIVGETPVDVRVADERVQVRIDCEDTGLLIGREGQNLAAVQYLAARMISRAMGAQVRVQVDAGDYHSRQDSRLRDLALGLAEKVRATGKPMSTKPLSAYQRRVIHMTLQEDTEVQTHSAGEGALKRVIIQRRKDAN